MSPIAFVRTSRAAATDDHWGPVVSEITLVDSLPDEAFDGIEDFSHVEIVYHFHQLTDDDIEHGARHPRDQADWPKVGIFAQRASGRPNRIGTTVVELVLHNGRVLTVRGLDAIDGTPVLDIKPVMAEFLPRGTMRQPQWSRELMREYWHPE
ncbi:MAG TPA: SAM-dependent methyltransferase [Gemmatimonadales bacterium]